MCYMTFQRTKSPSAPGRGRIFSDRLRGNRVGSVIIHACAVAGRVRHRVKKGTAKKAAAGTARASRKPRGAQRAAPKAKAVERSTANQGAHRGMNSTKNKKTNLRPAEAVAQPVLPRATQRQGFKTNEFIVYPAHGVGQIVAIEEQEVAGYKLELFVINFVKDKMTLRVPTAKIASVGMRKLAEP